MTPLLPVRHLLEYLRRRLVHHLNAGEIRQTPDLLGQGAVCPLNNLLKAFRICASGHEANFTTSHAAARRVKAKTLPLIDADNADQGKAKPTTGHGDNLGSPRSRVIGTQNLTADKR